MSTGRHGADAGGGDGTRDGRVEREVLAVVLPPCGGGRRVWVVGHDAGRARRAADVAELLRRAGIDPARMTDTGTVEWRGGGPQSWR